MVSGEIDAAYDVDASGTNLIGVSTLSMVFDVQLSAWRPRSCSTDGVKNALLISQFIKFNPLFFQKKLIKK